MKLKTAIAHIEKHGILLTYPIRNTKDPASLWAVAYPRTPMRWEWDDSGDNRVAELWHLREELSRSKAVVYGKWYQNRATFFSRSVFAALRAEFARHPLPLNTEAREILACLTESSPQSTKQLKRQTGLIGRPLESTYERGLRCLWRQLLVVGFGEVDEGAFPSLAVGASQLLFEDLEDEARLLSAEDSERILLPVWERSPKFKAFFDKLRRGW